MRSRAGLGRDKCLLSGKLVTGISLPFVSVYPAIRGRGSANKSFFFTGKGSGSSAKLTENVADHSWLFPTFFYFWIGKPFIYLFFFLFKVWLKLFVLRMNAESEKSTFFFRILCRKAVYYVHMTFFCKSILTSVIFWLFKFLVKNQ